MYIAEAATALALLTPVHHPAVTVHIGDTLSGLSVEHCGTAADWPAIAAANRLRNPNLIIPGWRLILACRPGRARTAAVVYAGRHRAATGGKVWGKTYGYPNKCGDGDRDGWDVNCNTLRPADPPPARPVYHARHRAATSRTYTAVSGSYEACVIARESGGNSQVTNSSGHWGLYQFSQSTWEAYGGSASSFGNASASAQRQVFLNAMAQGGRSNWSPYDGC